MNIGLIIYLIGLLNNIGIISFITIALCGILFLVAYIIWFLDEDDSILNSLKNNKIFIIISIISLSLVLTIPSKTDMYKILIGSQIGTTEQAIDKTKQTVDYIVDKIKEVK